MAEDIKLSAYLELQDHLSAGLNRVNRNLEQTTKEAQKTQDAMKRLHDPTTGRFLPKNVQSSTAAFQQLGGTANRALTGISTQSSTAGTSLSQLGSSALGALGPIGVALTAATAAVAAFSVALSKVVAVGSDFQNKQIRIAGTLRAFNMAPAFDIATDQAAKAMRQINSLAAALPGEASDYVAVFAQALPKAIEAGMRDVTKITDFTSRYTAVAISNTVDAQQAGMDLFRMLSGQAGADVRMWTVLSAHIGMTAEQFNKLSASVRQSKIDEAIKKMDSMLSAAGDTFDAKFGEMKSRLDEIVLVGGEPLFQASIEAVTQLNEWLNDNREVIVDTAKYLATEFGDSLVGAVDLATDIVDAFIEARKVVADIRKFLNFGMEKTPFEMIYKQVTGEEFEPIFKGRGRKIREERAAKRQAEEAQKNIDTLQKYAHLTWGLPEMGIKGQPLMPMKLRPAEIQKQYETTLKSLYAPGKGKASAFATPEDFSRYAQALGFSKEDVSRMWDELRAEGKVKLGTAPATAREINVNFNNNRFDIKQAFAEGFDPDRIAVAFASDLGRLGEFQMQSALAPYASVQ